VSEKGALRYLGMRGKGGIMGKEPVCKESSDGNIKKLEADLKSVEHSIEKIKAKIKNKEDKLSILENITHTSEEHKKEVIEEIQELLEIIKGQLSDKDKDAQKIRKEIHYNQRQEQEKMLKTKR